MMKTIFSYILFALVLSACSTTETMSNREVSARSRVEQRALSNAIENAFKNVDLRYVSGKKVFVETQSLSKIDIEFLSGFLTGQILKNGGFVVADQKSADVKIYNVVKVSGTDEIHRRMLSDQVRGEYKGTLSIIALETSKVVSTFDLFGEATEDR
jgi:PBP1b-binding outer membrane lipoprotein LpoB